MNNEVFLVCMNCHKFRKFYLPALSGLIKKETKEFLMIHWDCEVRLMDKRSLNELIKGKEELWVEEKD